MAQENNDNNNNNVNIPDQISWTKDPKEKKYRGTMVQPSLQSGGLDFGAQTFGKNASRSDTFSIPNDISGNAIDISFNGGSNGIKSSFPSIQPIGTNTLKQKEPIIEVIDMDVTATTVKNNQTETAPLYDGFQPHYAHHSNTMNPVKMQQTVKTILSDLVESGHIDFAQKSPFVYTGRAFGAYSDCEFLLSIFSDESSECIVEIRRSSGESFQFANIESNLLKELTVKGAINDSGNEDEDEEEESHDSGGLQFGFGFGFDSLPSLDSMELDSNFSATDVDDDDDNKSGYIQTGIDVNKATKLLQDAVDLEQIRDILRSDIANLNEQMAKNEEVFKQIPDIIAIIVSAINDQFYDCWAIKMYLGMVSKLISCNATIPSSLLTSIDHIKGKWCHVVINEVAPGVSFEFPPSQQIVRISNQIIQQLKQ